MHFSIIIPLYNKSPHIEQTIRSVFAQTHEDFEIIVVDDGSTDESAEIVAAINDPRLRLVRQANAGVSAARNKGIDMANSNFIAFLDADDLWFPNHLETITHLISIYPGCGMYTTSFKLGNGTEILPINLHLSEPIGWHKKFTLDEYLNFMIHSPLVFTSTTCMRKQIFSKIGKFEVGLDRGEDLDMWLRAAVFMPVAFFNEITAIYNVGAVNRSLNKWSPDLGAGLKRHAEMIVSDGFSHDIKEKLYEYYAKRMINRGQEALRYGYRKETFFCIKQSYKTKIFRLALLKLLIKYLFSYHETLIVNDKS